MRRQSDTRLWLLLGISTALHLVVLGTAWRHTAPELVFTPQPPSLSVSLEAIEVAAEAPRQAKPSVTKRAATPSRSRAKSVAVRDTGPTETPALSQPEIDKAPATSPKQFKSVAREKTPASHAMPALNRARILTRLRRDFSQHFYYPVLARRRNLQGAVTLGFGINGQGTIYDIQVVKSSGYAILDMAARDAMQRLGHVNWIRKQLQGDSIHIELPVIYRLTES
jgi:periplasmic protein TonB